MIGIFLARTNQCPNLDIYFLSIPSHLWRFDRCIASRRYSAGAPNLYWGLTSLVTTFLFFLTLGCWNMMMITAYIFVTLEYVIAATKDEAGSGVWWLLVKVSGSGKSDKPEQRIRKNPSTAC